MTARRPYGVPAETDRVRGRSRDAIGRDRGLWTADQKFGLTLFSAESIRASTVVMNGSFES